ncbi:MAG TPA: hypothetical protein VII78_02840 [Myxococcota bacterium]
MAASIKGSAFQSAQADVLRLIDQGEIDLEEVGEGLTAKDRDWLDAFVTPVSWMPISTYGRLLEVLARVEGGNDPVDYLRGRGREAGKRLLGGAYQGFARASNGLDLKGVQIVIGVARLLYDFMQWEATALPNGSFEIVVREAKEYPTAALHTAEGFLELYGELTSGRRPQLTSTRPNADTIRILVTPQ